MRNSKVVKALLCFFILLFIGCKKDISIDKMLLDEEKIQPFATSREVKEKLHQLRASLPAGYEKRLEKVSGLLLKGGPACQVMDQHITNVSLAACNDNPWIQWIRDQLADWDADVWYFYYVSGIGDFPFYYTFYFENSSENQYFGVNGEYTQVITKSFNDLHRFWELDLKNVVLAGWHSSMLLDREKLILTDKLIYDDDQATAEYWADLILTMLADVPQYRNGNHPIFTLNAVAVPAFVDPPYDPVPDKILMGDGIMESFAAVGFDDVAPQAILGHEFGHHIQFRLGMYDIGERSLEQTLRLELMADAFSAYYLSHARGSSMQWKRVRQVLEVFFDLGNCGGDFFRSTQRMAAAEWAYQIADQSKVQGHILTSVEFIALFDANLPTILAH